MKKVCLVLLCLFTLQSCSVVNFLKQNCKIETQVSGQSFICLTCNFNNANPMLINRVNKQLNSIAPCDTIR